ncbi:MAG: DNA repair protein RecN [Spirochaetes bacterium]|nr:DNA repair protein RecN [Spirochaetota bacterium]
MLVSIEIRNFVLIDRLKIRFTRGFNVLTGETGAGKSIIISALEIITGEKGSTLAVGPAGDRLMVTGTFDMTDAPAAVLEKLAAWGIAIEHNEIHIRREITKDGKSRSFINLAGVRVAQLKELGDLMVDIHGQHEHQSLFNVKNHLDFYDAFIGAQEQRQTFAACFHELSTLIRRHREIVENKNALMRERSFLEFAVGEIEKAKLRPAEEQELRDEIGRLSNFERIDDGLTAAYDEVYGNESSLESRLGALVSSLEALGVYDARFTEASSIASDIAYRASDIREILSSIRSDVRFDPKRLEDLNQRLFLINSLKKKYSGTLADVIAYAKEASEKLAMLNFSEDDIKRLETEIAAKRTHASALARTLSDLRRVRRADFVSQISAEISDLGMTNAVFDIEMVREEDENGIIELDGQRYKATADGIDTIEFLIAPNKGSIPQPLRKIASGGEISRIMLAMKTVLSSGDSTGTMVFDEIDSGVGGRIAEVIGEKIASLSRKKQVLAITHLPQIAIYAAAHFMVSKADIGERTQSNIEHLDNDGRVREIARMLAGKEITETTIAHARELLARAASQA